MGDSERTVAVTSPTQQMKDKSRGYLKNKKARKYETPMMKVAVPKKLHQGKEISDEVSGIIIDICS